MYAQDNNSLPVWIILSPAHHHIYTNSQPFLVGIVSRNMNSAEEERVDSGNSEDDDDFIPSQNNQDEELEYDDDHTRLDYDDDDDSGESMLEMSTDMSKDINMGISTGGTRVSMADAAPGVGADGIEVDEQNDCHITVPEVEDDENPGLMDREIEGVGDDGHDAQIVGVQDEHLDDPSSETIMEEITTADQDSGTESRVDRTLRYNLQKNRARTYKHVYDPQLYDMGHANPSDMAELVITTVDEGPEDMPQMSKKKGLKMFGEG